MKATSPWITYRTRFLVKAKQLGSPLTFTDSLGRQHSGRKGDYLVESSDGVLRIAPRQIFEDIYVPLVSDPCSPHNSYGDNLPRLSRGPGVSGRGETQEPHQISPLKSTRQKETSPQRQIPALLSLSPHLTRKSPQPHRDRRQSVMGNANVERAF
jgi:hypothetical protein